jgi:hypothetical protein
MTSVQRQPGLLPARDLLASVSPQRSCPMIERGPGFRRGVEQDLLAIIRAAQAGQGSTR